MEWRKAKENDKDEIMRVYKSAIGTEYCTWNEYYPGTEEVDSDTNSGNLFVLEDRCQIIGTVSAVPENELDSLDLWQYCENTREVARVSVIPDRRGNGIGFLLLKNCETELREQGCKVIHLLVAQKNIPAYKMYIKAGYSVRGSVEMYGNRYYACEKRIGE